MQIDRLNLEGYANLEHWVSELDQRIEKILLQRLTQIIQAFCSEFDRPEDGDGRRETAPLRDSAKRRGDKRVKDEKVVRLVPSGFDDDLTIYSVPGDAYDVEAHRPRNPDPEPGHLP